MIYHCVGHCMFQWLASLKLSAWLCIYELQSSLMCSFLPFNSFPLGKSGISEKEISEDEIEEENQRVITILRQQNSIKMIYMKIAHHCISRVNLNYLFLFLILVGDSQTPSQWWGTQSPQKSWERPISVSVSCWRWLCRGGRVDLLSNRSLRRALHACETKSGYDENVRWRLPVIGCFLASSKGVQDWACNNRLNVMFQQNAVTEKISG